MAEIKYLGTFSYLDAIDIENLGNFTLECISTEGYYYYMITKTFQGVVSIFTWGPIIPDVDLIPPTQGKNTTAFEFKLTRLKWNEKKICNNVYSFINNKDRCISSVKLIQTSEALNMIKDMKSYIEQFGEDHN